MMLGAASVPVCFVDCMLRKGEREKKKTWRRIEEVSWKSIGANNAASVRLLRLSSLGMPFKWELRPTVRQYRAVS